MTQAPGRAATPDWPLAVVILGLPLWWLLGIWQLMFLFMSIPMGIYLLRQKSIAMPRGFWLWMLWLGWVLTGVLVLQVDAPGAVPGTSFGRYLTFGYRFCWYVAATIVALYVLNARKHLSSERVSGLLAWFFVMLVAGGLLGTLAPSLSFPSLLQLLLPGGLSRHQFIQDLANVQVAQVQDFLGAPQARPSAPFRYTNAWGLTTALTLPFFVVSWWRRDRAWKVAMVGVLAVALYVIVASVNRGMWLAIVVMALFVVGRSILLGRVRMLLLAVVALSAAMAVFLFTPLGDLVQARLNTPHSDEGRANLGLQVIRSTAIGSPVVGFGSTRDVAGNFASIAGGASELCPKCEPPPLGTHGQLWLTIFGAGFVGAALFVTFLIGQLIRNLKARSPDGVAALCSLLALTITLPIYSSVGVALYIAFVAIGLLARDATSSLPRLDKALRPVLIHPMVWALTATLGGLTGVATHAVLGAPVQAHQRALVPAADLMPVPGARPFTLDGEALLVTSDPVIETVSRSLRIEPQEVRDSIEIGAHPNSRVMVIKFTAGEPKEALAGVELVTAAYLDQRADLLAAANTSVAERYRTHLDELEAVYRATAPFAPGTPGVIMGPILTELRAQSLAAADVLLAVSEAGVGRSISPAELAPSSGVGTVRVASGLALGLLLGVPGAYLVHDRYLRLGARPAKRLGLDLPVVSRIPDLDVERAVLSLRSMLPIAGVAADPDSAHSMTLALLLDERLQPAHYGGRRTLIVAEPRSRVSAIQRLYEEQVNAGMRPVGMIVSERTGSRR